MSENFQYIPLSTPVLNGNEKAYALECIETNWISSAGKYVERFEKDFSAYLNVSEACACSSGTAALHLALILSNISKEHEVIVPTLTFIATINSVKYVNADPVFLDCDEFLNICPKALEKFCKFECDWIDGKLINIKTKKEVKAITVVHVFGHMAKMEEILTIAKKYNLILIEDATEALGSKVKISGKYFYAGTIGDFGAFSFNGNKLLTTGGGGMLISKDPTHTKKAKYLSTQAKDDSVYYVHNEIGYNYRLNNIQAAIGCAQLEKIHEFIDIKRKNFDLYRNILKSVEGLRFITEPANTFSNYWFYSLEIDLKIFHTSLKEIVTYLEQNKIQTRPIWKLNHLQVPYLENYKSDLVNSIFYQERILNLPCSVDLKKSEIEFICKKLISFLNEKKKK